MKIINKNIMFFAVTCFLSSTMTHCMELAAPIAREVLPGAAIAAASFTAACTYGVLHDAIAAHICPAYFNRGPMARNARKLPDGILKKQLLSDSPTRLGLFWGLRTSWRLGAMLSIPFALAAHLGDTPRLTLSCLAAPIGAGCAFVAAISAFSGLAKYQELTEQASFGENSERNTDDEESPWVPKVHGIHKQDLCAYHAIKQSRHVAPIAGMIATATITAWIIGTRLSV